MSDGTVFERASFRNPRSSHQVLSPIRPLPNDMRDGFRTEQVRSHEPFVSRPIAYRPGSAEPLQRRSSIVLPSIETDKSQSSHPPHYQDIPRKRKSDGFPVRYMTPPSAPRQDHFSDHADVIDLTNSSERPIAKRQRLDFEPRMVDTRSNVHNSSAPQPEGVFKPWPVAAPHGREYIPISPPHHRISENRGFVGDPYIEHARGWDHPALATRPRGDLSNVPTSSLVPAHSDPGFTRSAVPLRREAESSQDFRFIANSSDLAGATSSAQSSDVFSSSRDSFPSMIRKPVQPNRSDDSQIMGRRPSELVPLRGTDVASDNRDLRRSGIVRAAQARYSDERYGGHPIQRDQHADIPISAVRGGFIPTDQVRSRLESIKDPSRSAEVVRTRSIDQLAPTPSRNNTLPGRFAQNLVLSRRSLTPPANLYVPVSRYETSDHDSHSRGAVSLNDRRDGPRDPPRSTIPGYPTLVRDRR